MSEFESQQAELKDLIQRANATPWGKTCSALWAQAAQLATEIGDEAQEVICYSELCCAYAMGGEHTKVLAPFIWQDKKFKEKPELYNEDLTYQLGWHYKYVISTIRQVPSIPVSKCFEILEEMRKFYLNHGDAMRAYYIRAFQFYRDFGMYDEAEDAYQKWYSAASSKLSDCSRCDPGYEITYYAYKKEWEKAAQAADKAMSSDEEYCDSQPEELLTESMLPWLYSGRDAQAWAAHIRSYRRYQQASRYLVNLPEHFLYLGISGRAGRPERLKRAVNIITRHLPWFKEAEDPGLLMRLCATAAMVLASPGLEPSKILNGTLPGDELTWIQAERLENPTYQQASSWFMIIARKLAKQFDERVGHPNPGITSAKIEEIFNPSPAPIPDANLAVKDFTGLGEMKNATYLTSVQIGNQTESTQEETVKSTDKNLGSQSNTDERIDTKTEDSDLPPINLYGEWRKLNLPTLLYKDMSLGTKSLSIYGLNLIEMLATNPENIEKYCMELDCAGNQALLEYNSIANNYLAMDSITYSIMPEDTAKGYELIPKIQQALANHKPMEAAQLADQAMRTDSPEPLGLRIIALGLMGKAAMLAGYYQEATDTIRQHLNLAAACGLNLIQLKASATLASLLYKQKQFVAAAEVAQTGLDLEHGLPRNAPLILELHSLLAQASEAMEHYETAAKHHYIIAQSLARNNPLEAVKYYQNSAINYARNHLYPLSFQAWGKNLDLCQQLYQEKRLEYLGTENQLPNTVSTVKDDLELALNPNEECKDEIRQTDVALKIKEEYLNILKELHSAYFKFCKTIVNQPGQVPDTDILRMENLMEEYRELEMDSSNIVFLPLKPEAVEADWNSDMGYMYAQCYKYQLAEDYFQAAIDGFAKAGEIRRQADTYLLMAQLYMVRELFTQAQEICEQVLDLLKDPKWIGSEIRSEAIRILKAVEKQL